MKRLVNSEVRKLFNKYTLFMAFPMILVLGQNITLLFFLYLYYIIPNKSVFYKYTHWIQYVVWLFMAGAIISVMDVNATAEDAQIRALSVLPNYIYWSVMLIFLINLRNWLNLNTISEYIFKGLFISIVFYLVSPFLPKIPGFLNSFTPNTYAFLCISFTAPAATYLLYKKGYGYALLFVAVVLLSLLLAGRRAGFVLVFISSMLSIHLKTISVKQIFITLLVAGFTLFLLQFQFVEDTLYTASPRIHELIYENDDISATDRSILTRKLMIEKSLLIYEEHPFTGIGLNNFTNYEVAFKGGFEGSEFIVNKEGMNETNPHNSYASLLGDGGLFLIVPFLIILFYNFVQFIRYYTNRSHIANTFYLAFLAMCVHLYFISAILNVYAWFMIGIVTAVSCDNSYRNNVHNKNKGILS